MSFKLNNLKSLVLVMTVFFTLSCNVKIGEKPPEAKMPEYKPDSCLVKSTQIFSDYFKGEAATNDVHYAWDCFTSMVQTFKDNVRCKNKDECSPGEIAKFVEDNFLDENKTASIKQRSVSIGLQKQLMKIKKLFLGGSVEYLKPDELSLLINLMNNLRDLFKELNPSMKILTLNWESQLKSGDVTLQDFESVNVNFVKIIHSLSDLIYKTDNEYAFSDFYEFLYELSQFSNNSWGWLKDVESFLPLAKKLKKSITGGSEDTLKDKEWDLFLVLGGRGYVQYLRYYYFIKNINPDYTSLKLAYYARTVEESFLIFYDLLNYKDSHRISKDEIDEILESFSNIWKEFKTSPVLTNEIMKIKRIVVGGNLNGIEKDEFLRAQTKVKPIKDIVEKFLPYYQFYGLAWRPELLTQNEAKEEFTNAINSLSFMANKVTDEVKLESGYSFSDLLLLTEEIERLYPGKEGGFKFLDALKKYSCLGQIGIDVLLDKNNFNLGKSCDDLKLTQNDLATLLKRATQIFGQYLNYHYFLDKKNVLTNKIDYELRLRDFVLEIVSLSKSVIENRKSKIISYNELDGIVAQIIKLQVLPKEIKENSIKSIVKMALEKIFIDFNLRLNKYKVNGLESMHLDNVKNELLNYQQASLYFKELYENKLNNNFNYNFFNLNIKNAVKNSTDISLIIGLREFLRHFQTPFPISITNDRKVIFNKDPNPFFGYTAIDQFNLSRFISGILIRSYSKSLDRLTNAKGLSDCEAKEAFRDLKPLLIDFDIISASSGDGFIDSRFLEANIFLPHSDGNDFISFEEIAELSNYIFSGFNIDSSISGEIVKSCQVFEENKEKLVDLSCLRAVYLKNAKMALNSMPSYLKYLEAESPSKWQEAFYNNLKAAGYIPRQDQKVTLSDASLFPHILQYGETLFLKFDQNYDGIINKKEGLLAFPAFENLLKKVAKKQIENGDIKVKELEALFTYILKYGAIPECNKSFVLLCLFEEDIRNWYSWKANYKKDDYDLSANRTQVASILGLIADMVSTSPSMQEESKNNKCNFK
jgi:hypothetical protein